MHVPISLPAETVQRSANKLGDRAEKEYDMAHILVDGIVSDIHRGSETVGGGSTIRGTGTIQVGTNQMMTMRIGNRVAELKSKSIFVVKDGERVIAAGTEKQGVLKIGAACNVSAGTSYHPPVTLGWLIVVCSILLGVPFSFILIGVPLLAFGIYMIFVVQGWKKSIAMVEEAVRQAKPLTRASAV
jgi:hypothetical protein